MNKQVKQPPKSQWWASIIYPNQTITIEYIDRVVIRFHLPCIISPLHDRDSIDGYPKRIGLRNEIIQDIRKKPHYHIMVMFPRAVKDTTYEFIKDKFKEYDITLVGSEMVLNACAMARYFIHLDNPEKAQYKACYMLYYGGLNPTLLKVDKLNSFQESKIRRQIIRDIINFKFCDVIDVSMYYESTGDNILLDYAESHSAMVEKYTRANYYRYNPRVPPRQKHAAISCNIY